MVDRLTDEERILAWRASWHPSFAGTAIVNIDFTFRSANPQFCKLLGVTPADLIGQRFQDITPPGLKELDEKNAELVISGYIDFYLLPKRYQFSNGREVDVILLVTRAPPSSEGDCQFFVARIMLDEDGGLLTAHTEEICKSDSSFPKSMKKVVDFMMKYGTWFAALGTIIGTIIIAIMGKGL